jgi:hypothetical protein
MGRCQSTPGLVESKDRTTVEEMWISPLPLPSAAPSFATQQTWVVILSACAFNELLSSILFLTLSIHSNLQYSPKSHRRDSAACTERTRITDSPGSMSPSVQSSDERPRSRITSHSHASRPHSQPSRNGKFSTSLKSDVVMQLGFEDW